MTRRGALPMRSILVPAMLLAACSTASPTPDGSLAPSQAASATPAASAATSSDPSAAPSEVVSGWRQLAVGGGPSAREDHTWTLAADGATAYLFGGRTTDNTPLADLWAFDLASDTWQEVAPVGGGPAARFGHNAAWAEGIGLVIFAGQAGTSFFNDLWAFDPAASAWEQLPAGGAVPVARYGSCAAIGPDGRLWISHGFTSEGSRFADTVAYDFTAGTWTDETPVGERPVERCLHGCWWSSSGQLMLYGGQTNGILALGDLWALTPGPRSGTNAWAEVLLAGGPPADRNLYASAPLDSSLELVFGGQTHEGELLNDAWVVVSDGAVEPFEAGGTAPPARYAAELIYHAERSRFLLFGGRGADGALDDLWELTPAS
jgi:hypothetical protein